MRLVNNRKNDSIVEREIAKFLNDNLYSQKDIFKEFRRTDEKQEQVSGSDLILSTSDGKLKDVIVDEKVASRYANKVLNTFSLELSFIDRRGEERSGWFIDESKKTEYYLLGWINRAEIPYIEHKHQYDTNSITSENIKSMDWCLVSRKKLFSFLEEKGWTIDRMIMQTEKIRVNKCVATRDFIDDVSFRYSEKYIEKPINLMLQKKTYINLSDYHGRITV